MNILSSCSVSNLIFRHSHPSNIRFVLMEEGNISKSEGVIHLHFFPRSELKAKRVVHHTNSVEVFRQVIISSGKSEICKSCILLFDWWFSFISFSYNSPSTLTNRALRHLLRHGIFFSSSNCCVLANLTR